MLVGIWLASEAVAGPRSVTVTYTTRFDLPPTADQVCAATRICDCAVTYTGSGTLREESGDRLTFEGTWKLSEGACNAAFLLWTPADGTAFHTFRRADGALTEWIAHDRLADTTRFEADIKARGQVWLSPLAAQVDPATRTAAHFERETGQAGPFAITSEHSLTVTFVE